MSVESVYPANCLLALRLAVLENRVRKAVVGLIRHLCRHSANCLLALRLAGLQNQVRRDIVGRIRRSRHPARRGHKSFKSQIAKKRL
ncbi:hypothetical protein EQG67_06170 [Kosakonia cowanii]|nr:hypothetical protein EQG67_06170 [Kosakonia cowanii]